MGGAKKIIRAVKNRPNTPASTVLGAAATRANRQLIAGRTIKEFFNILTNKVERAVNELRR